MDEQRKATLVKAVGRAIAARRAEAGLSQEAVAEALGISREAVSRMETGAAVPSVVRLAELAEIFECELEALIAEASNRKLDQAQRIAEMLDGLTLEKREILMGVIRQVVSGFSKD
ncbi:helix-turn-helix domain-containing protein [Paraburkholderia lycopersici]|uniref:Helix-turn-helix n=1 Tax=Paraburkholderia lycopersici TaxID=416944 RepID=A0A1G6GUZ9_9BURK|nr:helix-turn-helix transcriptional regulator [Paraburkholderia lycopersici]SDB85764.1 Helix-turn-helix [Paraburkholderia lycopersici]